MKIIVFLAAGFLLLSVFITGILFVSIVWTHRPDLSVRDILLEVVREITKKNG